MTSFDPNQRLFVEVEEKLTGNMWRGDFQSKYIEDITLKTGVPKKFKEFVRLMTAAFKCENDMIYIDLLTYQDLEALKNKKANTSTMSSSAATNNKKRYFILTETISG